MVVEGVLALHRSRALSGLEVQFHVDIGDRRHCEVAPGLDVLAPVVLARLLGGLSLPARPAAEVQYHGEHDRRRRERKHAQRAEQQRFRPDPMHKPRGVEILPAEPLDRQRNEGQHQAQVEDAVEQQLAPVERKRTKVAPLDGIPGDPVEHPPERVVEDHSVDGVDDQRHADAVHRVAIPEQCEERRHQRGPEDERGHEHAAPGQHKRHNIEAHGAAVEQLVPGDHGPAGDHADGQDQPSNHAVADGLTEKDRPRPDRRRVEDLGQSTAALLVQRLDRVEEEQQTDQQRERVELPHGHRARGEEQPRIERTDRYNGGEDRLVEDQRHEEIHPGATDQFPDLFPADDPGRLPEPERLRGHVKVPQGRIGRRRLGRCRLGNAAAAEQPRSGTAPAQPPGVAHRRATHGGQSDQTDDDAAQQESRIGLQGRGVIELDPAVHLQERLVEPAETGRVHEHQRPVHLGGQPVG